MAAPRVLYITFSILYLITLAIVLWFLLYYSGVPSWVWIFFGVAILIAIISLIMSEVSIKKHVTSSGKEVKSGGAGPWAVLYILLQLTAVVLVIIGLIFVIKYSSIPWWIWVILGAAVLLIIIAGIISSIAGAAGTIIAVILLIVAYIAYIVGIILLVIYSRAPGWIWILIGVMILFSILASIFEYMSERQKLVVLDDSFCSTAGNVTNCSIKVTPVSKSNDININLLPTSNIPEQVIYT